MKTTLHSVLGNRQRLDGGSMFGNAPRAVWSRWLQPDDQHRVPLACRALLIREPGRNILLETGIGSFFEPKYRDRFGVDEDDHMLLVNLGRLGLTHQDIDVVVLSHLHFDHAGGLLSSYEEGQSPKLLFPNATFVVGSEAWHRAQHPHARDRASFLPDLNALLEASGRLHVIDTVDREVVPCPMLGEAWRFHISHGHTPGLLLAEWTTPEGPLFFAGDLIPGTAWVHVPITMGYDRFPEQLIDEKERILSDLLSRGGRIFYTHDPRIALSAIDQDERGRFHALDPVEDPMEITL